MPMQGRLSEEHLHVENATWDVWYDETKSAGHEGCLRPVLMAKLLDADLLIDCLRGYYFLTSSFDPFV